MKLKLFPSLLLDSMTRFLNIFLTIFEWAQVCCVLCHVCIMCCKDDHKDVHLLKLYKRYDHYLSLDLIWSIFFCVSSHRCFAFYCKINACFVQLLTLLLYFIICFKWCSCICCQFVSWIETKRLKCFWI